MLKNKKIVLTLFLALQILLVKSLALYPDFIEEYYSKGLYLVISSFSRYILGWIPFSVGDICYILLILYLINWCYKNFRKLYKKEQLLSIISFLSVAYFLFNILWGLNYYRNPLHKTLNLEKEYTTEELAKQPLVFAVTNTDAGGESAQTRARSARPILSSLFKLHQNHDIGRSSHA